MRRVLLFTIYLCLLPLGVRGDEVSSANSLTPSWETQRQAATYALSIPAPRGQITDRNGVPFAQNRISYNLSVIFPTPLDFTDIQVVDFVNSQVHAAQPLLSRPLIVDPDLVVQHYRNRGAIPFDVASDLSSEEVLKLQGRLPSALTLRGIYVRFYPQGACAGHVIGYTGRTSRASTRILQNNEALWPESEGREGLEQSFDDQLQGRPGQLSLTFDRDGRKVSEKISAPPTPGYNLVSTLDIEIQKLAEKILQKRSKRGALVVIDPNTGEVLALASWPTINPNDFVPSITQEKLAKIESDPNIPMLPRAFRSAYPAGSTFKVFVGIAALETHTISPKDQY
ncbi:MAG: hypothetical protein JOY96_11935, partial [Verrucomicrobia bacterium]|nr:hypothetical protein [Verrucomicrobiota bacterium]